MTREDPDKRVGDYERLDRAAWCAGIRARIAEVHSQIDSVSTNSSNTDTQAMEEANQRLEAAEKIVAPNRRPWPRWWQRLSKADALAAQAAVHEAEVEVLRQLRREEVASRSRRFFRTRGHPARRTPAVDHDSSRARDGDVEGLSRSAWCARVGAHVADVQSQINRLKEPNSSEAERRVIEKASQQLAAAREVVSRNKRPWSKMWRRLTKADAVAALANVHEAEVEVLRLLHREELKSQVPRILAHAESQLGNKDDGLIRLRSDWERANKKGRSIPKETKDIAAATLHAANEVEDEQRARVHSFTQILICSIVIMFLIAIAFAIWASLDREVARIFCFPDENIVNLRHCPIGFNAEGSDIFLVEFTGMFAAALAGAVSLRRMQGTSGPYHVSVLLLLLRLPVGALTALLGILLISGEFFPGLTRLDSGPQIIAWAAAFGVLQETVTRTVDKQGRAILSGASEEGSGAPQPPEQEDSDRAGAKPGPKNRKLTRKEGQG